MFMCTYISLSIYLSTYTYIHTKHSYNTHNNNNNNNKHTDINTTHTYMRRAGCTSFLYTPLRARRARREIYL